MWLTFHLGLEYSSHFERCLSRFIDSIRVLVSNYDSSSRLGRVNPEHIATATMRSVAGTVLVAEAAVSAAFAKAAAFEAVAVGIANAVDAGSLRLSVQC